jgi:hypothetical protein
VLATADVRKLGQRANGVCTQQGDGFANGYTEGKVFDVPTVLLETCFLRIVLFTAMNRVSQ